MGAIFENFLNILHVALHFKPSAVSPILTNQQHQFSPNMAT